MIKRTFYLVVILLILAACSDKNLDDSQKDAKLKQMKDRQGNTFNIPKSVAKIISISPAITETLVDLGLGDNIIAVDDYSKDILGIAPNLPTFNMLALDVESIIALKPDLILATGMSQVESTLPLKTLSDLGISVAYIPSAKSLKDIKDDLTFIGQVTNTSARAEKVIQKLDQEIEEILDKIKDVKQTKTVYFEISASPQLYSFGSGTFLNEMIELLGGKNVFSDLQSWISVSEEAVMEKNPDVIFTNTYETLNPVEEITSRTGWEIITAVQKAQVFIVDPATSSNPNENITVALEQMAKALYPSVF